MLRNSDNHHQPFFISPKYFDSGIKASLDNQQNLVLDYIYSNHTDVLGAQLR